MKTTSFALCIWTLVSVAACSEPSAPAGTTVPAAPPPAAAPVSGQAAAAQPQVAPQHSPKGDIQFEAVLDLNQQPSASSPQLRNGQEAASKDWPASLYVTFDTPDGRAACTAALIGPQVMLTAAHCVPTNGTVTFVYKGHQKPYATSCTRHPRYPADASADYALCSVTPTFAAPAGFTYETVNTSAMNSMVNRPIILTGFGCVSDIPGAGPPDGKYRIGGNSVDEASDSTTRRRGPNYYEPAQRNNLLTRDDPASANLCPGDSGGPAFVRSGGGLDTFTNRTIVGVNSRVFYRNVNATEYGSSLISATGGPDFLPWAQGWAKTANVAACGIAGLPTNCRS